MKNLNKTTLAALLATLLLSACGSGDDEGYNTDFTPPTIGDGGNGSGDNGNGSDNDNDNDEDNGGIDTDPEYDYSRNGVFTPIVLDTKAHFDYETNSRLVVKDYEFEYFGTTEPMLYIKDFEWNGQELTMPFVQFIAQIGFDRIDGQLNSDRMQEVFKEMFNDCELGRYSDTEDGFYFDHFVDVVVRCGGFDVNGDHLTYSFRIRGEGEYREYVNDWLYEEPVTVLVRDRVSVTLNTITEYVNDPTRQNNLDCVFNSRIGMYTEEFGNENPTEFKLFEARTPDRFSCNGYNIL